MITILETYGTYGTFGDSLTGGQDKERGQPMGCPL